MMDDEEKAAGCGWVVNRVESHSLLFSNIPRVFLV